ncbi:hypothetical protein [Geomonas sp.]|nr:hypothetical protein [Geomonas sp.]HJV33901.1 hypothetical protein [Geomonas sp.]
MRRTIKPAWCRWRLPSPALRAPSPAFAVIGYGGHAPEARGFSAFQR